MNGYKDKLTNNERRYLYSVPLLFLLGFGVFLIRFVITTDVQFDFNGKTGVLYNILGALITGYGLASECTTIHFMLNQIRDYKINNIYRQVNYRRNNYIPTPNFQIREKIIGCITE